MEYKKNFADFVEKSGTGSQGRALAALGYGTLQSLDLDEGIEKGRIVDAPVSLGGNNGKNGNGKIKVQVFKPSGVIGNEKLMELTALMGVREPEIVKNLKQVCGR